MVVFALAVFAPPVCWAQSPRRPFRPFVPPQLEGASDAWAPRLGGGDAAPSPAARVIAGPFVSVQVNIDSAGNNIPNDAANEPSIAISATNPNLMAIGYRQFDSIASSFRQAGLSSSTDGGQTWFNAGPLEPGVFRSDPVLDSDADGRLVYNSLCGSLCTPSFTCDVFISNDGSAWTGPIDATGGDKAWMTIDRTAGPGRNHIYSAWSTAAGCCGDNIFTRSTDGGLTFMKPIAIPQTPVWGTLAVGSDGAVYVCGVSSLFPTVFHVVKSNNAQNPAQLPAFGPAVPVNLGGELRYFTGPNPGGLVGQVWIACDHSNSPAAGNVYLLCSVDPPGPDPLDVMIARSSDGGQTWSPPVRINNDPPHPDAWQWFGTMSVAPSGRIDVFWYDTRASLVVNISELYYAYSHDGGATWTQHRASPAFDSFIGWPNQNKIGDYIHSVSDAAAGNLAYSATFNGEQDVYFLRAGDCNNNGMHDALDIASGTSRDLNANFIPDECEGLPVCPADCAQPPDGVVNTLDLLAIINGWGPAPPNSPLDIHPPGNPDGVVNVGDLLTVINNWGPCGP